MTRLGVIIALRTEAETVLGDKGFEWRAAPGTVPGVTVYRSGTEPVNLVVSGVGKANAAYALGALRACGSAYGAIASMGTSGSLGADPIGAIRLCFEAVEWDMDASGIGIPPGVTPFEPMSEAVIANCVPALRKKLETALRKAADARDIDFGIGRALSGDSFIDDNAQGERIMSRFGTKKAVASCPDPLSLLVDMETAAVAKLCHMRNPVPFFALRWVSDNANQDSGNDWDRNVAMASRDLAYMLDTLCPLFA